MHKDGVYNKSVNEFTFEIGQSLVSIGNCSLDDAGFELAIRCWLDDRQRFYIKLLMTRLDAPQLKRVRYSVWGGDHTGAVGRDLSEARRHLKVP
ncbi:hypothetical protein CPB97_000629 [Podila verticillata]|nr:hypothetical protein CPB97_000629 [Podila verticillata]